MKTDAAFWLVLVGSVAQAVLLLIGLLGLARYRQLPQGLRYLVGLIWFGVALELASTLLHFWKIPNLLLLPLDAAGELWLLAAVYAWALQSAAFTRLWPWVAGGFAAYAALSSGLAPELARFKPGVLVLECLLVLGLVGLYFRKLLNELRVQSLADDPMFWVSTGLLLYSLAKLQIALFSNYMLAHYSMQLNQLMWAINAFMSIVLYLCYCRALWMRPQK
ncbi:hypothetical protein [Hymenobacter terricola]|uniref:hypothetical protein n=1 Tax=Hymenobacter terricola TaxID=2819236 RepID=UPI001B307596|nr:hypothetical protein [Hymenobacter terricola]